MLNPVVLYKLTLQIIYTTKYVRAHIKEKKLWYNTLPALLERQRVVGNLEPLHPQAPPTTTEWITTNSGALMVLTIYDDIRLAIEYFRVPPETQAALCLSSKVVVRTSRDTSPKSLRDRIGARWHPEHRARLLSDKTANPFLSLPDVKRIGRFRLAGGLLRKASRSDGFADLFVPRLVGLAQLCGVEAVNLSDLAELAVHAPFYEKLARAHVALLIRNVDVSRITNLSLGNIVNNAPLGSTQNVRSGFAEASPKFTGRMVAIGTVQGGKPVIVYPKPMEQLYGVSWQIASKAQAKEGEQIFMLDGWAAAVAMRPELTPERAARTRPGFRVVRSDVHGSPLYNHTKITKITFRVKRVSDGRLIAKPAGLGFYKMPKVTGQGIFGRACDCMKAMAGKRIDAGDGAMVNGVKVDNSALLDERRLMFHNLYLVWETSDIVMLVCGADKYFYSTYIQAFGECMYCAVNRALGTGCTFLIAGGGRRSGA